MQKRQMYSVQTFFTYIDVTWGSWVQESFHGMAMFGIIFHSPHGRPKEWANLWTTMRRCCTENTAGSITSKKARFVMGAWRGAGSEDARCFVKREESRHQDTYSLEWSMEFLNCFLSWFPNNSETNGYPTHSSGCGGGSGSQHDGLGAVGFLCFATESRDHFHCRCLVGRSICWTCMVCWFVCLFVCWCLKWKWKVWRNDHIPLHCSLWFSLNFAGNRKRCPQPETGIPPGRKCP